MTRAAAAERKRALVDMPGGPEVLAAWRELFRAARGVEPMGVDDRALAQIRRLLGVEYRRVNPDGGALAEEQIAEVVGRFRELFAAILAADRPGWRPTLSYGLCNTDAFLTPAPQREPAQRSLWGGLVQPGGAEMRAVDVPLRAPLTAPTAVCSVCQGRPLPRRGANPSPRCGACGG